MRWSIITMAALMAMTPVVMADQGQHYQDNVNWAKQADSQVRYQSGYNNFDADELCKDAACRQGVANPEQSRYRNDAAAMESAKTAAMATDDSAQAVTTSFNNGRPTIDPTDTTWAVAAGIQNNAYNISHGITDTYTDCSGSGKRCATDITHHSCQTLRTEPLTCFQTATYDGHYDRAVSRTYGPPYVANRSSVSLPALPANTVTLSSITFTAAILNANRQIRESCLSGQLGYKRTVALTLTVEGRGYPLTGSQRCVNYRDGKARKKGWSTVSIVAQTVAINRKPSGSISISYPIKTYKTTTSSIRLNYVERIVRMKWTNSCAENPETASCGLKTDTCIEGAATRTVAGIPVYQSCWKYKKTYQCGQGQVDTCEQYASCQQTDNQCSETVNGQCIKWNKNYTCESQTCDDTTLICGEQSYCLDGECFAPTGTQNNEFNQAASSMAAVSEAAKGLGDPPKIFSGKVQHCSKKRVGFSDCCKDGGWGNDIGLADCSAEEKALGDAKESLLTIYVGQYCADKVLGTCLRYKKTYCVFDSKLARIIQEQGRPQIGLSFGSAKTPDCNAITPEQMQQMDFSHIDFSDFYSDLHSTMTLPDTGQIQQRIQQAMENK